MTVKKVVPNAADELAEQMELYQKTMADSLAKYEELVADAQSQLEAIVQAATPKPKIKPEAQWTEANGNKLLVLNEEAANFFMAIFDQVGVLAKELAKLTPSK